MLYDFLFSFEKKIFDTIDDYQLSILGLVILFFLSKSPFGVIFPVNLLVIFLFQYIYRGNRDTFLFLIDSMKTMSGHSFDLTEEQIEGPVLIRIINYHKVLYPRTEVTIYKKESASLDKQRVVFSYIRPLESRDFILNDSSSDEVMDLFFLILMKIFSLCKVVIKLIFFLLKKILLGFERPFSEFFDKELRPYTGLLAILKIYLISYVHCHTIIKAVFEDKKGLQLLLLSEISRVFVYDGLIAPLIGYDSTVLFQDESSRFDYLLQGCTILLALYLTDRCPSDSLERMWKVLKPGSVEGKMLLLIPIYKIQKEIGKPGLINSFNYHFIAKKEIFRLFLPIFDNLYFPIQSLNYFKISIADLSLNSLKQNRISLSSVVFDPLIFIFSGFFKDPLNSLEKEVPDSLIFLDLLSIIFVTYLSKTKLKDTKREGLIKTLCGLLSFTSLGCK